MVDIKILDRVSNRFGAAANSLCGLLDDVRLRLAVAKHLEGKLNDLVAFGGRKVTEARTTLHAFRVVASKAIY